MWDLNQDVSSQSNCASQSDGMLAQDMLAFDADQRIPTSRADGPRNDCVKEVAMRKLSS